MGIAHHHIDQYQNYNTTKAPWFDWLDCVDRRDELYNITKIFWFLGGRRDDAKRSLEALFDAAIDECDADTVYCHCCHQRDGESVKLLMCSGCKVTYSGYKFVDSAKIRGNAGNGGKGCIKC